MLKIKDIILSGVLFVVIDSIYLGLASNFFNKMIKRIQGSKIKFRLEGAILCYIFLIFGLNHFIISQNKSPFEAALLGWVIYGVYETTNYAILNNWSIKALIMDTVWGGILFYATTFLTYKLKNYI